MGLTERDLPSAKFDLVQADKSTQLLSIGQLDVRVKYEASNATITVVFCPDVKGMLISWIECIALNILHPNYPRPIAVRAATDTSILAWFPRSRRRSRLDSFARPSSAVIGRFLIARNLGNCRSCMDLR